MSKNSKIYLVSAILIVAALITGAILIFKNGQNPFSNNVSRINQPGNISAPKFTISTAKQFSGPGFSFSYPPEMTTSTIPDENGTQTILVQNSQTGAGLQIYISPFDESKPITAERIKQDLPDQTINNPGQITVDGTTAVSFESDDAGKTREVWFNRNGQLYQITTYAELSDFLNKVLATWKFQ